MTNEDMLVKIRKDRPHQLIHEVIDIEKNKYGFYTVNVDMEIMFIDTKVLHGRHKIPYPLSKYNDLSESKQLKYRLDLMF
jgi:hypothetical protein